MAHAQADTVPDVPAMKRMVVDGVEYVKCWACGGSGVRIVVSTECWLCHGTGWAETSANRRNRKQFMVERRKALAREAIESRKRKAEDERYLAERIREAYKK